MLWVITLLINLITAEWDFFFFFNVVTNVIADQQISELSFIIVSLLCSRSNESFYPLQNFHSVFVFSCSSHPNLWKTVLSCCYSVIIIYKYCRVNVGYWKLSWQRRTWRADFWTDSLNSIFLLSLESLLYKFISGKKQWIDESLFF